MLPFPTGNGQWVGRDSILHRYARHRVETDDSDSYIVADYFAIGVETTDGNQVDIHQPYKTETAALAAAGVVAQVLNLGASGPPIDVRMVVTKMSYPTLKSQFLVWSAILLFAVYAAWRWW